MLKLKDRYNDSLKLDNYDAQVILNHPEDELCKATSDLFIKLFARFTRNYVWSILPYGGLYIVGSTACQNPDLFAEKFSAHYDNPEFYKILKEIPIYLVKDTNVGLYGAANYLLLQMHKKRNS